MAVGQTYDIPGPRFSWFKEQIEKLARKAAKLTGDKVSLMVVGKHMCEDRGPRWAQTEMFEVFVSAPEIKINGFELIGSIDHITESGNIVREAPGMKIPVELFNNDPICEHCNINRRRNSTFILRCDDGTHKQVGRTCLADFTGHPSISHFVKLADLLANVNAIVHATTTWEPRFNTGREFRAVDFYAPYAAQVIMQYGWVSAKRATENHISSTRDHVMDAMSEDLLLSEEAYVISDKAIAWAQTLQDVEGSWAHNANVVAHMMVIDPKYIGILVSIVGAYYTREYKVPMVDKVSTHQGIVGQRSVRTEVVLKKATPAQWGLRHVFEDDNGNIYVWFKDAQSDPFVIGHRYHIDAKVSKHSRFGGIDQTDLNYMRIKKVA